MPEIAVSDLPPQFRQLAVKARDALAQHQDDLVLALSQEILRAVPGCLGVRRLQRTAQVRHGEGANAFSRRAGGAITRAGFWFRRKDGDSGKRALAQAETILASDPWSRPGLRQLAMAAAAMDLPETAVFAWECLVETSPGDRDAGMSLAQAQLSLGRHAEALAVIEVVLQHHPQDSDVLALKRQAAVAATIEQGPWNAATSFRGKLRDAKDRA